jgi:hypothetical protein
MGDDVTTQGSAIGDRAWAEPLWPGFRGTGRPPMTTLRYPRHGIEEASSGIEREGGKWKDY